MAIVNAVYGKLTKPELGGGGLIIQTGVLDWGTELTAKLSTPISHVLYAGFIPSASAPTDAKAGIGNIYLTTHVVGSAAGAILVRRLSAVFRYCNYLVIGY